MNGNEPNPFFTGLLWGIGAVFLLYVAIAAACYGALALQVAFFGG